MRYPIFSKDTALAGHFKTFKIQIPGSKEKVSQELTH